MPLPHEDKLKEDFDHWYSEQKYINPYIMRDYWLSKIAQHHKAFVESVRREIEKTLDLYNAAEVGIDREIAKHLLSLPILTLPINKEELNKQNQ